MSIVYCMCIKILNVWLCVFNIIFTHEGVEAVGQSNTKIPTTDDY